MQVIIIIFIFFNLLAYNSYAAEDNGYLSDTENCHRSVSPGRRRVPLLSLASAQQARNQSLSLSARAHTPIESPIGSTRASSLTMSPKQKWQKSHPKQETPLLINIAEKAYRQEVRYEFEEQAKSSEQNESDEPDEESEKTNQAIAELRQKLETLLVSQKEFEKIIKQLDGNISQTTNALRKATAIALNREASRADRDNAENELVTLDNSLINFNKKRNRALKNIADIKKTKKEQEEQLNKLEEW